MWRMQSGERVLTAAEWCCLSDAVDWLRDGIESDVDSDSNVTDTGIAIFDRLTAEQKLLILADTVEALVVPEIPCPDHTAVNEGTIAAIFATLRQHIDFEMDMESGTHHRRALLAALADDPPEEMPAADCDDGDEWDLMVEFFTDRVLWDRDFEIEEVADLPPEAAAELHEMMRFGGREYFSTAADEPAAGVLENARLKLRKLVKDSPELPD
jgi:hypothetical protein